MKARRNTAHLRHNGAQGVLHKRSGEVEKPKQGEVGEVILERSEVDSVGVKVCQYPVELKGKGGGWCESHLLGDQPDLLSLVEHLPEDVLAAGKHNVAGAHVAHLKDSAVYRLRPSPL